jgi:hypothetical protein
MIAVGIVFGILAGMGLYVLIGFWLYGYYDSKNDDPYSDLPLVISLLWPAMLPAMLMVPLFNFARASGDKLGKKQLAAKKEKLAQLKKIRIETEAAMKEVDDEMKVLEIGSLYQHSASIRKG